MKEIYREALGLIDLTTLNATDTVSKVEAMVQKVNDFHSVYPNYPLPASICVYPNFAGVIKAVRKDPEVHITVVGGCFPASQSPLEVKTLECVRAVEDGADEVDIVLALNAFLERPISLSALDAYLKCPARFYYERLCGLVPLAAVAQHLFLVRHIQDIF